MRPSQITKDYVLALFHIYVNIYSGLFFPNVQYSHSVTAHIVYIVLVVTLLSSADYSSAF